MTKLSLMLAVLLTAGSDTSPSREEREMAMSEWAILNTLMISRSKQARNQCWAQRDLCINSSVGELGMALIARQGVETSSKKLAELLRFRLDAGYSTDLTCYLLEKRDAVLSELVAIDARRLTKKCESEVGDFKRRNNAIYHDVPFESICRTEEEIGRTASDIADALRANRKCPPQDF